MIYAVSYIIALLVYFAVDVTWLTSFGAQLYKQTLGDILAPDVRLAPAAVFYLLYPIGLIFFAVEPALRQDSWTTALIHGALFGLFAYGTYELTNFATLRNWTLGITVIDTAYGAIGSGAVAALTYATAPAISRWFGS